MEKYQYAIDLLNQKKRTMLFLIEDKTGNISDYSKEEYKQNIEKIDLAVEALEKQISKKPIVNGIHNHEVDWECPICRLNVVEEEPYDNYCMRCGQRIDWSE